jgi:hypothetical protein
MTGIYERLTTQMEKRVNAGYVDESILDSLGLEPIDLEDISIEKWMHKNLTDLPEAAVHAAGYSPTKITLAAEEFGHSIWAADLELRMSEKDWAFAEKHGLATMGIENMGKTVGKGASRFLMTGRDGHLTSGLGAAVEGNTNFILDEGSGAGTLTRPITITKATAGAWANWANMNTDIVDLITQLETMNYNLSTTMVIYPKCAAKAMKRGGAAAREGSAIEILKGMGIKGVASIPNQYVVTDGNALPVIGAFDLIAIDLSKIKIGYTRKQRTKIIAPHDEVRETIVQCEVWFTPYCEPYVVDVAGTVTTFKGVSKITAINGA